MDIWSGESVPVPHKAVIFSMGDFYIFTYQGKHSDSEIKDPPDTTPAQIVSRENVWDQMAFTTVVLMMMTLWTFSVFPIS